MRVMQFSFTFAANGLGRAWSNWLALTSVGVETVTAVPEGGSIWKPVADEAEFVQSLVPAKDAAWIKDVDAIVALKPRPGSYDLARKAQRRLDVPLILDIDDPDFEARYGTGGSEQVWSFLRRSARLRMPVSDFALRAMVNRADAVTLSNPSLRRWYGNRAVVPHCREPKNEPVAGAGHEVLVIAFVGTVRAHKGTDVLREAVRRTPGFRLVITDGPPRDAAGQEDWRGQTSAAEGRRIVTSADVVAVPSTPSVYANGQLPAKLIDAMAAGKTIVASDVPPVRWALGDAGLLVRPGSVEGLVEALERARDPELRELLGARALRRAKDLFAPSVVGAQFVDVVRSVSDS